MKSTIFINNAKFGIIFLLLFTAIYSFLNRKMQNPPVSAIISAGLSALITIPILQRGLIEPFLSPDIVDWVVIIALGITLIFLFYKFSMRTDDYGRRRFSLMRLIIFLGVLIFIIYLIGDMIPDTITFGPVGEIIDWIKSLSWWAIWIAVIVAIIGWWLAGHRERRSFSRRYRAEKRILGGGGSSGGGWFGRKKEEDTDERMKHYGTDGY